MFSGSVLETNNDVVSKETAFCPTCCKTFCFHLKRYCNLTFHKYTFVKLRTCMVERLPLISNLEYLQCFYFVSTFKGPCWRLLSQWHRTKGPFNLFDVYMVKIEAKFSKGNGWKWRNFLGICKQREVDLHAFW